MQKIVECKLMGTAEGKFDLIETLIEGDALRYWLEFKQTETARTSKKPNASDTPPLLCMSNPTFSICLQELKKHYFPKKLACFQKAYLCNHVKKPNKLNVKNTTAHLCGSNGMLAQFL
eukprot:14761512-Ditylum_brightwellii.AAC.1